MEITELSYYQILLPSPLEECPAALGCISYIKRDDLIHPLVSGNKYRKLKYVVQNMMQKGKMGIITFGGAFSNHIYATAAYCHMMQLNCAGIIRGEEDVANPTLQFARAQGMHLYFVSREEYSLKGQSNEIKRIIANHPGWGIIPEGGDHELALIGVAEILDEIEDQYIVPDYIALSCGTGTTAAGILKSILQRNWHTKVIVIPALNNHTLRDDILLKANAEKHADRLIYKAEFSGEGYAKAAPRLIQFMHQFYESTHIPLDPVYTGKLFFGVSQLAREGYFQSRDTLILLHTGGLQGNRGYNYLLQKQKKDHHLLIRYGS